MNTIECFRIEDRFGKLVKIGTVTSEENGKYSNSKLGGEDMLEDAIWNLCNWSCWGDHRTGNRNPTEIHHDDLIYERTSEDKGFMNSDLVIVDGEDVAVSLPVGWKMFSNVEEAVKYRLEYEIPLFY